jgi:hypothetical protein
VGLVTIFYCLRFETSLFVASYGPQVYGGGIRHCLHTEVLHSDLNGLLYSVLVSKEMFVNHSYSRRVQFVSDRMSYIILRGRWCDIFVLNVHAPTEDKIYDVKDRFYEELEQVFDKFLKLC